MGPEQPGSEHQGRPPENPSDPVSNPVSNPVAKDPNLSKRTVALHTGYVGTGYKGSSINRTLGEDVTIEQILEKAILKAGLMLETNFGSFSRTKWSRASRTDKGVHSLGTVMSLRMLVDDRLYTLPDRQDKARNKHTQRQARAAAAGATSETGGAAAAASSAPAPQDAQPDAPLAAQGQPASAVTTVDAAAQGHPAQTEAQAGDMEDGEPGAGAGSELTAAATPSVQPDVEGLTVADQINAHLPPAIRVFAVQKVNKKFNARHMCNTRTYEYYLPAFLLGLKCDGSEQDAEILASFRSALKQYVGHHAFHNYTNRKAHEGGRVPGPGARQFTREKAGDASRPEARGSDAAGGAGSGVAGAATQGTATQDAPGTGEGTDGAAGQLGCQQGSSTGAQAMDADASAQQVAGEGQPAAGGQTQAAGGQEQTPGGKGATGTGTAQSGQVRPRQQSEQQGRGRKRGRRGGSDDEGQDDEGSASGQEGGELDDDDELFQGSGSRSAVQGSQGVQGPGSGPGPANGTDSASAEPWRPSFTPICRFNDPRDLAWPVANTFYRQIMSFTADDPKALVEGGTPCLKLRVHGQSFMIHHIRHMIGSAVLVARGLLSAEVLAGSLCAPSRVSLPKAPPHTLLLADCDFFPFPPQMPGPGDNDLINVTGPRLRVREGAHRRKEAFREQVLLPALQQLVDLPEWQQWLDTVSMIWPFKQEDQDAFLEAYRVWEAAERQRKEAKAARYGRKVQSQEPEDDSVWCADDDEQGGGAGGHEGQGKRHSGGWRGGRGGRGGGKGGWGRGNNRGGRGRGRR